MQKWNSILFSALVCLLAASCGVQNNERPLVAMEDRDDVEAFTEPLKPIEPQYLYGKRIDSFSIHTDKVKRNENLSEILSRFNVSYPTIHMLAKNSKDVFDVRGIKAGNSYCIMYKEDSVNKAACFVYELNAIDFVVFELGDSINIYKDSKQVTEETKVASGVIESSLYLTMSENNIDPMLSLKLSEIYAWAIDFYRIQKGDKFKVIYTEKYVEGEPVGIGDIQAAYFSHMDNDFYAIHFQQGEQADYFDEQANSLRKAFLQSPVKFSRISSGYTMRRFHPVQKRYKAHLGTDYAASTGTPIMATGDGVVIEARYAKYNGRYVKIRHNGTYMTQYLHMSRIASGIKYGTKVKQGDVIGYVGSTGLATGPHVCYRFWKNGSQVNHRTQKIPPSEPVKKEYLDEYNKVKEEYITWLDSIEYPVKEPVQILSSLE